MKKYLSITAVLLFAILINAQDLGTSNKTYQNTLMNAGAISVTIGGDFIVTGTFPALITERVDQFVTRIYNQAQENALRNAASDPQLLLRIKKQLNEYSLRNIKLKRSNGDVLTLDLLKFRIDGDFVNDPYLKNDDVLIFAPLDLQRNFFQTFTIITKSVYFGRVDIFICFIDALS
jgi:hypothetical protein